jgi:hypothetical protein
MDLGTVAFQPRIALMKERFDFRSMAGNGFGHKSHQVWLFVAVGTHLESIDERPVSMLMTR